jgi:hypothetical protein
MLSLETSDKCIVGRQIDAYFEGMLPNKSLLAPFQKRTSFRNNVAPKGRFMRDPSLGPRVERYNVIGSLAKLKFTDG